MFANFTKLKKKQKSKTNNTTRKKEKQKRKNTCFGLGPTELPRGRGDVRHLVTGGAIHHPGRCGPSVAHPWVGVGQAPPRLVFPLFFQFFSFSPFLLIRFFFFYVF
jgi:hypothetical protein